MKRLALIGVLALVCVGAGSAAPPSVKATAAARERAATLTAQNLLHELAVPPGATRITGGRYLDGFGEPIGKYVDLHRFWALHASASSVVSFVKAHIPSGYRIGDTWQNGDRSFLQFRLDWQPRGVATRTLDVAIEPQQTRTVVRVDAQVLWIYPRSPQEAVPTGVTEIDIKAPRLSRTVTDAVKVRQIVQWFNALPVYPPGVALACPLFRTSRIQLTFRSANGTQLASASAPTIGRAWVCDAITFVLHGKQQTSLIDQPRGRRFVRRLEQLLGFRLSR